MVTFSNVAPDERVCSLTAAVAGFLPASSFRQNLQGKTQMCPIIILNECIATDASLRFYQEMCCFTCSGKRKYLESEQTWFCWFKFKI